MTTGTDRDFGDLARMRIPVKRAAYSGRTAWIMAILAELAYTRFDEEDEQRILELAEELATLTDRDTIAERLAKFRRTLGGFGATPDADAGNRKLRAALECGGFRLAGSVLYDPGTDTQGFVAYRRDDEGTGMAVICFRGTTRVRDWMTNMNIQPRPIADPRTGAPIGNMHRGFHDAYRSVHDRIAQRLAGLEDLPLYITGHSLGGALAVVATWYQSSQRLAACYTFGAPRVGDQGLIDRFKTPIYRIVNGPDPVPLVPPPGFGLEVVKGVVRVLGFFLPFWGWAGWITDRLIRSQRFRHYGYMRYLTVAKPGPEGDYPGLRLEFALSTLDRLTRFVRLRTSGTRDQIVKYHDIAQYRSKLRAHALRANPP